MEGLSDAEQEVAEQLSEDRQAALLAKLDIDEAFNGLTTQQRLCMERMLEGQTQQEMADALSINRRTVRQHLAEAHKKLRKYFQDTR